MIESHVPVRVLVVDDDAVFLGLMGSFLSRLHCSARLIQDSSQVLQFLRDNDVDICFMDIVMPQIGGAELTRMIRQDLKKVFPIIAVSAFYMTVDGDEYRQAGMSDILQKPVCCEDVKRVISQYT